MADVDSEAYWNQVEDFFKKLGTALSPQNTVRIDKIHREIPYRLECRIRTSPWSATQWNSLLTGIFVPKYDEIYDGPHNNVVRRLISDLFIQKLDRPRYGSGIDLYSASNLQHPRIGVVHDKQRIQEPDELAKSHFQTDQISLSCIDAYLQYRARINQAIDFTEQTFLIDPLTKVSKEWGLNGPLERKNNYPTIEEALSECKKRFALDYLFV